MWLLIDIMSETFKTVPQIVTKRINVAQQKNLTFFSLKKLLLLSGIDFCFVELGFLYSSSISNHTQDHTVKLHTGDL